MNLETNILTVSGFISWEVRGKLCSLEKRFPASQNIRGHGFKNFFWVNVQLLKLIFI